MDTKDSVPQKPIFSGESGRACEVFVRDIRAYAFSQSKQRDNAWMADFAAMCLDGAALRWFSELEPDIQEDWALLNKALLRQYPSDKELESAMVPSPASAVPPPGSATLPTPAAAPPFRPLRETPGPISSAVNNNLPRPRRSSSSSSLFHDLPSKSAIISTPAAAPPLALRNPPALVAAFDGHDHPETGVSAELVTAFSESPRVAKLRKPTAKLLRDAPEASNSTTTPPNQDVDGLLQRSTSNASETGQAAVETVSNGSPTALSRIGRIKAIIDKGSGSAETVKYVHRSKGWLKCIEYTDKMINALLVKYTPSIQPGLFEILNSHDDHPYLGIVWTKKPIQLGPGSRSRAQVVNVSLSSTFDVIAPYSATIGESDAAVWTVGPDDTIRAGWGDEKELDILFPDGAFIYVAADQQAYIKEKGGKDYKTRWVFEQLGYRPFS